ncbi:uncharacterized protein GBIM_08146 [Gryllus bimaculatus]|nr:uncharacterized protein GBIM_08146 [Gryllus bimaculatus]
MRTLALFARWERRKGRLRGDKTASRINAGQEPPARSAPGSPPHSCEAGSPHCTRPSNAVVIRAYPFGSKLLVVYSVTGQLQMDYDRSQRMTPSYSVKEDNVTLSSENSTSRSRRVRRQWPDPSYLDNEELSYYYRFHSREPITEAPPKQDPWPKRPHTLNGSLAQFPLSKCCQKHWHLHEALRKCDYERVRTSPRPWLQLPLDAARARFPDCAPEDMLRLGAVEAHGVLRFSARGALVLRVRDVAGGQRQCCGKTQALVVREASVATVEPSCKEMTLQEIGSWKLKVEPWPTPLADGAKEGFLTLPGSLPTGCRWGLTRAPPSWATPHPGKDFRVFSSPSVVFCADPIPVPVVDRWMAALGAVGSLALAAAVVVHALLPELRATPFGRALMTYSVALLALAVVGLGWTLNPDVSSFTCLFNSALDKTGKAARRRYLRYAQYAWGCPFLTVTPVVALQFTHAPGSPWRPIEWFMKCHYSSSLVQLLFLYAPLLLLFLLNCGIFVWTAYRIRVLQKGADILTDSDSNDESPYPPRKRLLLFLKLLWLMGVGEAVLELVAWSVSATALWYTANVVDLSRALCVFWLSCCKGTVGRRLRARFRDGLCCEALRRGSRVGPDPDPDPAVAATDSTAVFGTPNSDTAASSWSAKSPQGARVGASAPPEASGASPPNGFFKGASSRGVAAKEAEADGEPPPGGIEMKKTGINFGFYENRLILTCVIKIISVLKNIDLFLNFSNSYLLKYINLFYVIRCLIFVRISNLFTIIIHCWNKHFVFVSSKVFFHPEHTQRTTETNIECLNMDIWKKVEELYIKYFYTIFLKMKKMTLKH